MQACPHCGEALAVEVRAVPAAPSPIAEQWLEPCTIAYRLGIGEQQVRRLCRRGMLEGAEGIRKDGGRWLATMNAIEALRRV